MEIILDGCLIALMKRFDALITIQNLSSLQSQISEKIKKNRQKLHLFKKTAIAGGYSDFFQKTGLCRELGFFAL